jgi:DNA-binding response OmpR family regulator
MNESLFLLCVKLKIPILGNKFKMGRSRIFVVEDDKLYAQVLRHKLSMDPDFEVVVFNDGKSLLSKMHEKPSVVTLDHALPDITGLELLKRIKKEYPSVEVIILSAQEDVGTAIEMIQGGAYDYIIKDAGSLDKLWFKVHQARDKNALKKEMDPYSVGLDEVAVLIDEKRKSKAESELKVFEKEKIRILKGPYGPYIKQGLRNYKIPKEQAENATALTIEEVKAIIEENKANPPKKPVRKKK